MPEASPSQTDRRSYWNERYRRDPSRFGDEPNRFVREVVEGLPRGTVLDVACGRGRNAVWLAKRGHEVTGIDLSDVAIDQARQLANAEGVHVEFEVADFLTWDVPDVGFDLVLLSYLHLPEPGRLAAHRRAAAAVAVGGHLLIVAHHRENLEHGIGGPDDPAVLYDEPMLAGDFVGLTVARNERVIRRVETEDAIDVVFLGRREGPP